MERAGGAAPAIGREVARIVRARRLLAGTLDDRRALGVTVSRRWILGEVERHVAFADLPEVQRAYVVSRLGLGAGPAAAGLRINTNTLPKLEPAIGAHVLTGVMLEGARRYGAGTPDARTGVRCSEIGADLVVAAMIHETPGLPDRHSALLPEERRVVDDDYVEREFGEDVKARLRELLAHLERFRAAFEAGSARRVTMPPPCASAVAAIAASGLRLTARAAGDGIFAMLDEEQREELRAGGIEPGEPGADFPERPYLERDYRFARAAVELDGVDDATIGQPVRGQLLASVANVLFHGVPPAQLVGRFGSATRGFHNVLPLKDLYSPINRHTLRLAEGGVLDVEGPYAPATLHVTGLEVVRYLDKVRRKGFGSGAGHSFTVSACAERLLGGWFGVPAIASCDCHDIVEDGGLEVSGYDQTLDLFAARFGAPLAALVAEVTDSVTRGDGPRKARAFLEQPELRFPAEVYNVGQLDELRAVATDPEAPYTIVGAVMKIADTCATRLEGIRDPDLMTGVWRHSGARVHWDLRSKGRIVDPLLERLAIEVELSATDPFYARRPGALARELIERLRATLAWAFEVADQYAVQNLTILGDEYALEDAARDELLRAFAEDEPDDAGFARLLDRLLDDQRLDPEVRRRGYAATYRLEAGNAHRDLAGLTDYRALAARRRAVRARLGIAPPEPKVLEDVVRLYRL